MLAAALIGYFGVNAYDGNHGIKAKQDIDRQTASLTTELAALRAEEALWQRRIDLLKSGNIDEDMLDERARALLDDADSRDLIMMIKPDRPAADPTRP